MIALKIMGAQLSDVAVSCYSDARIVNRRISSLRKSNAIRAPVDWRTSSPTTPRLKREDISCIIYDSAFSQWKVLVGESDWNDHSAGREGAEKYRIQNLPNCASAGVYELAVAVPPKGRAKTPRQLDSDSVIPVYLGQAENVRVRVQSYGRDGAHLEKDKEKENSDDSLLLFSDVFSRGFPIVYRWAPTRSKEAAEMTEDELLRMYDYGWNKRNNGDRRAEEIRRKLSLCCTETSPLSIFRRAAIQYLLRLNQLGQKVKSGNGADMSKGILYRMLEMTGFVSKEAPPPSICSASIGDGVRCTKAPVKGRKRCAEHKGMKA